MKNLIKINPTSFILGVVLGGLAIFTIAADSHRPAVWDYNVIQQQIPAYLYTETLNNTATNGWELVSSQIIPKSPEAATITDNVLLYMVLKHPKQ